MLMTLLNLRFMILLKDQPVHLMLETTEAAVTDFIASPVWL